MNFESAIVLPKTIRGRLGNQLFLVHLAAQISYKFKIPIISNENVAFEVVQTNNIKRKLSINKRFLGKTYYLSLHDLVKLNGETLQDVLFSQVSRRVVISLPNEVLGAAFYKFIFDNPRNLMIPTSRYQNESKSQDARKIALHFRGKDFHDWNVNAFCTDEYYLNALEMISFDGQDISIFTDDPESSYVRRLSRQLKGCKVISNQDFGQDFWQLSSFETIVSSASTFSVWAAMLGTRSNIFLPKKWVDYCNLAREETDSRFDFWSGVASNEYALFKTVSLI